MSLRDRLIDDWKWVLTKAWSVRFIALAAVFSALEVILPLYVDQIPLKLFSVLSAVCCILGLVFRIYAQRGTIT